jgi:Fur family transcriptional regulator, ferric uptake regulator
MSLTKRTLARVAAGPSPASICTPRENHYHGEHREDGSMDIEKRVNEAFQGLEERRTEPRRAIARNLVRLGRSGASFSADDLLQKLRRTNPRIGRATVYRSIEKLVRMKVLDRIEFADGKHSFRMCANEKHHHHLACTRCHRVIALDFCLESDIINAIGKRESFDIDDHSITLFGLCKECQHRG